MTRQVIINILETGGGGTPPESDPVGVGLYLPDAYEGTPFFAVVEFLFEEIIIDPETEEETVIITIPNDVTSDFDFENFGLEFTKVNVNTVRIEGSIINVFLDQFYRFVLPDLTTPILPFDTEEEFLSLIEYKKPSSNTVLFEYTFKVFDSPTTFEEVSVFQWINWLFTSAVANIDALVAKGLK